MTGKEYAEEYLKQTVRHLLIPVVIVAFVLVSVGFILGKLV